MTQRLKAIKIEKCFLCQSDTHKHMPLFQWRYIKVFGEQVTCLNVLQPKTTRSKSVGNQVGFILDTVREITQYQGRYCPCKVLEHIQPGVPKL